jgi:NADH-quinone oxidoreductase subunit J
VGAIAVLFLFIVMMLNIEQNTNTDINVKSYYVFSAILILFLAKIFSMYVYSYFGLYQYELFFVHSTPFSSNVYNWVEYLISVDNIIVFASLMYTYYYHLLIIVAEVLLLAMVASISLTLTKFESKKGLKYQDKYNQIIRSTRTAVQLSNWN